MIPSDKASLTISLSDGSKVRVRDCEYDLLAHLLFKYDFDRKMVEKEIDWICGHIENPSTLSRLLVLSLRQFSSELYNKILAKSISENVDYKKVVEDMLIDINKVTYLIAENAQDIRKVLRLRRKIFVGEEGYPPDRVINGFEKDSLHIMASVGGELVGVVSIAFDGKKGLPLDSFIDLRPHRAEGVKCVEIDKLAVVGEKRKRELSFQLMWLCYSVARFWGAQRMFIFTMSKKIENLKIYKRFGFKEIGTFLLFDHEYATALKLDFSDIGTYEKKLSKTEMLRLGKKLLNRFSLKVSP